MITTPDEVAEFLEEDMRRLCTDCISDACNDLNRALVMRNLLIGKAAHKCILDCRDDAEDLFPVILEGMRPSLGSQFGIESLRACYRFYIDHENILETVERDDLLPWQHYRALQAVDDDELRSHYEKLAISHGWTLKQLEYAISSNNLPNIDGTVDWFSQWPRDREDVDAFLQDPDVTGFLGMKVRADPTADPRRLLRDMFADHLIGSGEGYSLAFRDEKSTLKGVEYVSDLVFFNYILDCFIIVDFLGHEPDRSDQDRMVEEIDAFNRKNRPKGKKQTLGILIGFGSGGFNIVPSMKFNQTNIRAFYNDYQERLGDFAESCGYVAEQLTLDVIRSGMGYPG